MSRRHRKQRDPWAPVRDVGEDIVSIPGTLMMIVTKLCILIMAWFMGASCFFALVLVAVFLAWLAASGLYLFTYVLWWYA